MNKKNEKLNTETLTVDSVELTPSEVAQIKAMTKRCLAEASSMQGSNNIDKAEELRMLLQSTIVDEEKTIMGSEPFYTAVVQGKNRDIVMNKLIEVISRF